jgi:tetratricopeptide (TPR) repeat protein
MKARKFLYLKLFLTFIIAVNSACVGHKATQKDFLPVGAPESASADKEIADALGAIEKMPDKTSGYNKLAVLYIRKARETGDFSLNSKAEAAVNQALEIAPADVSAQILKASLHVIMHRFKDALELGTKLEKDFPNDFMVQGILTDANIELGRYTEAVEAGQKMVDLKPAMPSYARAAHLRSLYGDHDGAIEMYKLAARTADPLDKEAQSWCLAQLGGELMKYGKYEEAERVYDEALQNFPNYHLAIAGKGRARAAQGDFEAAIRLLTDALNRVPNIETAILLGDIYTKKGDAEKAKQQYNLVEVIGQKIGAGDDQKRLAVLWADRDTKLDEALTIARREYESKKDIFTADALAWVLYKKGEFEEAKKISGEAMRLGTNDARILYHAGMIEKRLGSKAEAKRLLQTALKINPSFDLLQSEIAENSLRELN